MSERDQLKAKIKKLTEKVETIKNELFDLEEEYAEKYTVEDNKELYLHKYYKYKDNCYGLPKTKDDYWDVYYYIIDVTTNGMVFVKFQKDSNRIVTISKELDYCNMNILTEITKEEYNEAFDRIIETIDYLRMS
jgi:hypothetical protein